MDDWSKIKAEYIRDSSSSYRKLAAKYGVSKTTLEKRAKNEKWLDLRRQKEAKTETRIVEACATKEAERTCKAYEAADIAINRIIQMLEVEILPQNIKSLTSALKDCAAVKGLQTEADRREQEARIAKLHRDAEQEAEKEDTEFVFRIQGLSEEDLEGIVG